MAEETQTDSLALSIQTSRGKGVLHELTGVILQHGGDISAVAILDVGLEVETVAFEIQEVGDRKRLISDLQEIDSVSEVAESRTLRRIFGNARHGAPLASHSLFPFNHDEGLQQG